MNKTLRTLLWFFSSGKPGEYVGKSDYMMVSSGEMDFCTDKPILVLVSAFRVEVGKGDVWRSLTEAQKHEVNGLRALFEIMVQLGIWGIFSTDDEDRDATSIYQPIWDVVASQARRIVSESVQDCDSPIFTFDEILSSIGSRVGEPPIGCQLL